MTRSLSKDTEIKISVAEKVFIGSDYVLNLQNYTNCNYKMAWTIL